MTQTALITGGARRIGACICKTLHAQGFNVIIHYRNSETDAKALQAELNQVRPGSANILKADLNDIDACHSLAKAALNCFGELTLLVNNASTFYPTPIGEVTQAQWHELHASNTSAPFFLSQALLPPLRKSQGNIINISDIHASSPLKNYSAYCIAKAGLNMLTRALAKECAPDVRVNAIAPGAIAWPEDENALSDAQKQKILDKIPLKRAGSPTDIAETVLYFNNSAYVTGQIISIDGGRSLSANF